MERDSHTLGQSSCSEKECTNPCTRLKEAWIPMCEDCFVQGGCENYPDQEMKSNERFPEKHRGLKKCPSRRCHHSQLIIVYDDECDEWLFCVNCKGFKQLLRCWNKVTNSMVDALDRPMLRWQTGINIYRDPDTSDESDASQTESDDESPSFESMKDAGMTDGSDDSDHSNVGSDDENSDIPPPVPIVYHIVPTANGKKAKATSSATPPIAAPIVTNLPLNSTDGSIPPPQLLPDVVNHAGSSGKLEQSSENLLKEIPPVSENQAKRGNKPVKSAKQSNQEEESKKKDQTNKEESPPPPLKPTPAVAIDPQLKAGIPKPTHIPVTAESLAAARLKVAAEKKAAVEAAAAKLLEEEQKRAEKATLEKKKRDDAAAVELEKKLQHERLVAAEAAKKQEIEQKKAAERRKKAEEEKKAKAEQEALIQKLLDDKKAKKEATLQKKREEEEQKAKDIAVEKIAVEKKQVADDVAAARKRAIAAETRAAAAVARTTANGGGGAPAGAVEDKDPDDYCCPVSLVLMQDPVVAADGITYDRGTIQDWFDICIRDNKPATSPITASILPHTFLIPNNALKNLIDSYKNLKGK